MEMMGGGACAALLADYRMGTLALPWRPAFDWLTYYLLSLAPGLNPI
jgi:hypothetical protein